MSEHATLLTPPHNYAVIQLPTRNFPGVVVQGDSLSNLVALNRNLTKALVAGDIEEATDLAEEIGEQLEGALSLYTNTCIAAGRELPFVMDQN
jgi:hypothetical protein